MTFTDTNKLTSVVMTVTADDNDGKIFFKPSAAIPLADEGASGVLFNDAQYMTFGWWRTEPTTALGTYEFWVFADGEGLLGEMSTVSSSFSETAEYDGTAVGMYVEQGGLGGTGVTTRQGEFVANVRLNASFANPVTLSGKIDGFTTTPTGGSAAPTTSASWSVELENDGTTEIGIRGTTSDGSWSHSFVGNHANPFAGTQPPAVVGSFNASIANLLHLVGAFGAERL